MIIRTALLLVLSLPAISAAGAPWTSSGPAGGETRALVAAEDDRRLMYAASSGGVFRTDDGGASWHTVTGPIADPVTLTLAPSDPGVVIVATRTGVLYRSDDHGGNWRTIGAGLPPSPAIRAIAIDPRNANVVYAGMGCGAVFVKGPVVQWHENAGVFKSVDGGVTFTNASAGLEGFQLCVDELALDPLNADTVYVTPTFGDSGYPRSDDGGATWVASPTRVPGGGAIVDPANANVLYGTAHGEFLRSENRGATWELQLPTLLPAGRALELGTLTSLALDPAVPRFFFGGRQGAFRSGDRGASVLPLGGAGREATRGIVFDPATSVLTIGTVSGVYQSSGWPWDEWRMLDTGDRSRPVRTVLPSRVDAATAFAATTTHIYVTHDYGRSWAPYAPSLPGFRADQNMSFAAIDASDTIFAVGENDDRSQTLFRWTAGASEWARMAPPVVNGRFNWFYVDDDDPSAFYVAAYDGNASRYLTFRTRDGGTTWERGPSIVRPFGVNAHVVSRSDPNVMYVAGGTAVYRSADRGVTWIEVPIPAGSTFDTIAVDPRDADTIYIASYDRSVFRSRDGGRTWTSITGNIPDGIRRIALSDDGNVLHAATEQGVWELRIGAPRIRAVR